MKKIDRQRLPLTPVMQQDLPLKIFGVGDTVRLSELRQKLGAAHAVESVTLPYEIMPATAALEGYDLIFDLNLDEDPSRLSWYAPLTGKILLACSVKKTLLQLHNSHPGDVRCTMIGLNALPTFINRSISEIALLNDTDAAACDDLFKYLQWEYLVAADRTGMVTPRVIAMIINEACFALAEKTASMHDIDMAMKSGTNYPYGPFEWCDRIGVKNVFETLEAFAENYGEARYRICPLLKEKYLLQQPFY